MNYDQGYDDGYRAGMQKMREVGQAHKHEADLKIGAWLSAALEDPSTCQSMKDDISEWFKCTPQMEVPKREWVGLTWDEMSHIIEDFYTPALLSQLCRAIEAKLKEKNI